MSNKPNNLIVIISVIVALLLGYGFGRFQNSLSIGGAESSEIKELEARQQEDLRNVEARALRADAHRNLVLASVALEKNQSDAAQGYLEKAEAALAQGNDTTNKELAGKVKSLTASSTAASKRSSVAALIKELDALVPVAQSPGTRR